MRKMIKAWREKAVRVSFLAALLFFMNPMTVYATGGGIGGSKLATGTQQLIQDSTTFLMVIAPIVAGLFTFVSAVLRPMKWIRKNGTTGLRLLWFRVLELC